MFHLVREDVFTAARMLFGATLVFVSLMVVSSAPAPDLEPLAAPLATGTAGTLVASNKLVPIAMTLLTLVVMHVLFFGAINP